MLVKKISNNSIFLLTSLTLLFLSLNSIFCKSALQNNYIDAFSFSFFRLLFAFIVLGIILFFKEKSLNLSIKTDWTSGFFLFLYAITFSYSYINLDAGLGALVLFAIVQITIIIFALLKKESLTFKKLLGIFLAFLGLVIILYPKEEFSISIFHFSLMSIAGFAWAIYTILGKKSKEILKDTTNNFLKATIFVIIFFFLFVDITNITFYGLFLSFLSGGITSGIGYVLWYQVLRNIDIVSAGVIQLLVPIIAIFLSVIFLDEKLTTTLISSTFLILFGIYLAINKKAKS